MKKIVCYLLAVIFSTAILSQERKPVKVLLLGTFHFDNPGLDVAKFKNADILSSKRQQEVLEVVNALKKFSPDKIFVESPPDRQNRIDSSFSEYKSGRMELRGSELY